MPAGTCIPSQLHGIHVRHAMNAHCCSGVSGLGPAHGTSGPPHGAGGAGSAWAVRAAPIRPPKATPMKTEIAAIALLMAIPSCVQRPSSDYDHRMLPAHRECGGLHSRSSGLA
ncbi:hypothetical protein BMW24_010510 [Mycobacterium heckeshornense]|nr:hypothetical protein BMW24_010510 [Mycobacterium heckeshornense]